MELDIMSAQCHKCANYGMFVSLLQLDKSLITFTANYLCTCHTDWTKGDVIIRLIMSGSVLC